MFDILTCYEWVRGVVKPRFLNRDESIDRANTASLTCLEILQAIAWLNSVTWVLL